MALNGKRTKRKRKILASRCKSEEKYMKYENTLENLPLIKQSDIAKLLPKYTTVISGSVEERVIMDDLDHLQHDLEKLLSTNASRNKVLKSIIECIKEKKKKNYHKTPLNRKQPEKSKYKNLKNGKTLRKKPDRLPINYVLEDICIQFEVPKIAVPTNNSDKFWTFVDPYCRDVTKDDMTFLDTLIEDYWKGIDYKIPKLGVHYAHEWLPYSQGVQRSSKCKSTNNQKKPTEWVDRTTACYKQPAPIDGKKSLFQNIENLKCMNFKNNSRLKFNLKGNGPRIGLCMNKKLKQIPKISRNDEILAEIRKCHQELKAINEFNLGELKRLKFDFENDLQKHNIIEELGKIDKRVVELYNKVLVAKKSDINWFEKSQLTQQLTNEFEDQCNALLRQQFFLSTWSYNDYNSLDITNILRYYIDLN